MPNILGYCLLWLTIKGEVPQYYKGLFASIKNNHVLIKQFFFLNVPLRGEDFKHHTSQLEILLIRKDIWRSFSSTSLEGSLSVPANQPLCCQTPGNRLLDSYNTLKENIKSDQTCMFSGDLEAKISWNWGRQNLLKQLSQDVQTRSIGILLPNL